MPQAGPNGQYGFPQAPKDPGKPKKTTPPSSPVAVTPSNPLGLSFYPGHDLQQEASAQARRAHIHASIIQRQMILRNNGFNVSVDGHWGAKSQGAWAIYRQNHHGAGAAVALKNALNPKPLPPALPGIAPVGPAGSAQQMARQAREMALRGYSPETIKAVKANPWILDLTIPLDKPIPLNARQQAAKLARDKQAAQTARVMRNTQLILQHPESAATLSLRNITDVLTSPDSGLHATTRKGAIAAQSWLNGHGYKVSKTGSWDAQTNDAFTLAFRDAKRRIEARQSELVVSRLYNPAHIHAGDPAPDWLYNTNGVVPTPLQLLHILSTGGMAADSIYQELAVHAKDGNWQNFQHRELLRIASSLNPMLGTKFQQNFLHPSSANLYADIALTAPNLKLSPYWDAYAAQGFGGSPLNQGMSAEMTTFTQRDEDRRQADLAGQARALFLASSPEDFSKKLMHFTRIEENKMIALEQQRAADSQDFFTKSVGWAMMPGHYLRQGLVMAASAMRFEGQIEAGPATGYGDGIDPPFSFSQSQQIIDDMNPWVRFAFESIVDPINFLPVGKIGSTTLRFATRGESLGTYTLVRDGTLATGGWKAYGNALLHGTGVVYRPGTWTKIGVIEGVGNWASRGAFGESKAWQVALKSLEWKEVALAGVRERIGVAMRHGFNPSPEAIASGVTKFALPADLLKPADQAMTDMLAHIRRDPTGEFQTTMQPFVDNHISLRMDKGYTAFSQPGAQLNAYFSETASLMISHRIAGDAAAEILHGPSLASIARDRAEFKATLEQRLLKRNPWKKGYTGNVRVREPLTPRQESLIEGALSKWDIRNPVEGLRSNDEMLAAAKAEYQRVLDAVGAFLGPRGIKMDAADMKLWKLAQQKRLKQLAALLDEWRNTILQAIQSEVEMNATASGHDLWEEVARIEASPGDAFFIDMPAFATKDGPKSDWLWTGREGELPTQLTDLLQPHFDPANYVDSPNPQFGIPHDFGEKSHAIEAEIARNQNHLFGWQHRTTLGQLPAGEGFDAQLAATQIRDTVEGHWEKRVDGFYYDTRAEVKVSPLYGRLYNAAWDGVNGAKNHDELLLQLSQAPRLASANTVPFLDAIDKLVWRMGGRGRNLNTVSRSTLGVSFGTHPTSFQHVAGVSDGGEVLSGEEKAAKLAAEIEYTQQLHELVGAHQLAQAKLYDRAYPQALKDAMFIWQAALHAENTPIRIAARAISAGLNLWVTLTLPFRPGWALRNFFDNWIKVFFVGAVRDPRMWFQGAKTPGALMRSIFDVGVYPMHSFFRFMDSVFGTNVASHFGTLMEHFWEMPASVLRRIFDAHGISVSEAALQSMKDDPSFRITSGWEGFRPHVRDTATPGGAKQAATLIGKYSQKSRDAMWELMGNRPENYWRRVLYRDTIKKERKRLRLAHQLHTGTPADLSVEINQGVLDRISADLGISDPPKLDFRVIDDPNPDWVGLYDYGKNVVHIQIPSVFLTGVKSLERSRVVSDAIAKTILHEMRHTGQMERRVGFSDFRKEVQNVFEALPYSFRPSEIGANLFARTNVNSYPGLVTMRGTEAIIPPAFNDAFIEAEAHRIALQKIEDTLFDYSKVTVLEDNLRVFFPFVQFWQKNTWLWGKLAIEKPWVGLEYAKYEEAMQSQHDDLPAWMRRYVSSRELIDAAAVVPGLDSVVSALIPNDTMYDPLNFTSAAPIYRSFLSLVGMKGEPNMPGGEGNGWPVIGPILSAMNEWGLGVNPLIEKPLEHMGIAASRSWQTVFPEAGPIIALAPDFWLNHSSNRLVDWARIAFLAANGTSADDIAKNMDFYIHQEIAGQVARGETPDEDKARKTIQDWFFTQNMVGFFSGMYLRRATPADIYLSKLYDDAVTGARHDFTTKESQLLHLWAMRGVSRYAYDKYLEAMPEIETYYKLPDYQASQAYLDQHPELTPYVDSTWRGQPFSQNYVKQVQLHYDADYFFQISQLSSDLGVAHDVRVAAESLLLTPAIKAMWAANSSPAQRRNHMMQGLIAHQLEKVNAAYFQIPENNFSAREDYLNRHPELVRLWNQNNTAADDYEAIMHNANAELRQRFFNLIDANKHSEADAFLADHPFLWEDTKNAYKFDPETGRMKLQYLSAKARAYLAAKPAFDKLNELIAKFGKKAAWNWLYNSSDPSAVAAREYIKAYGKNGGGDRTQHALDYAAVKGILASYFNMPKAERDSWLQGKSEEAGLLRAYFKKWANDKGMNRHAMDYLSVSATMQHYFTLSKYDRKVFIHNGSKEADQLLAYFKKYGATHKLERRFAKIDPNDVGGTPEQRQRLLFWKAYFALTPDKRPGFIASHAEKYGVFVYGPAHETWRDEREQAWLRRAHGAHFSSSQLSYLYVKPLLDFYQTLKGQERNLFAVANPELEAWLVANPPSIATGNKQLDKTIEQYFRLSPEQRGSFITAHPEIQTYFDKSATPATRAIHALLSQFFALTGLARKDFASAHPEIAAFFVARRLEAANISAASQALYMANPDFEQVRKESAYMVESAQHQLDRLKAQAIASFTPDSLEENRDRTQKYTGHSTGRHRAVKPKQDIGIDPRYRS